jgi:hypothetical protein
MQRRIDQFRAWFHLEATAVKKNNPVPTVYLMWFRQE